MTCNEYTIIKMGRWEHGVCNRCAYDWKKDAPLANVPSYCPNCGVKMDLQRIWRESESSRNEACGDFQISADYGCDITRFDAYCKDYDNTLKQIWESVSK